MFAGLVFCRRPLGAAFALALILSCVPACNLDRYRGEGFQGATKNWGNDLRPASGDVDHGGFSTKAREIENHLGS